ncbi:SUKH-4 immunity protein of toxin-antitoxin system [Stackebrandtia albiflava]|uniref:SUKH-4 immunity protein of toxin-antitoxin system n=1 Tax=Stackebrandtia albiflava TaxID=406432 RepID=A0A562V4Q6_9ACTN|nr:SUKH-4 immunity protein of toxin-antitoxin system [Stackebrandtia albiflava]
MRIKAVRDHLVDVGLPASTTLFVAAERATGLEEVSLAKETETILNIGYATEGEGFYGINCRDGSVVYIESHSHALFFVNSAPSAFVACLALFYDENSRVSSESDPEDFEKAARSIARQIHDIDEPALVEGGFWQDLLFDVALGDYAEEA